MFKKPDNIKGYIEYALAGVLLTLSSWFLSVYLRINPVILVFILLIAASFAGYLFIRRSSLSRKEAVSLLGFSAIVDIVIMIGSHIHIGDDPYTGTLQSNYIEPYTLKDAAALVLMLPCLMTIFSALYSASSKAKVNEESFDEAPHCRRQLIILGILFVLWLPYLLTYWPGIILGDTLGSINQALGITRLHNNHPVMHTFLVSACMHLGKLLFNSNTVGYAIYTIVQMLYVGFGLSYILNWVWRHGRIGAVISIISTAVFGLYPYFAAFSVAGWKDPIFSISVAMLSVYLLNDVMHPAPKKSVKSYIVYVLLLVAVAFSRNNGIGVLLFVALWQVIAQFIKVKSKIKSDFWFVFRKTFSGMALATIIVCVVNLVLVVPVFYLLRINFDMREPSGLMIQQMARVAALDGNMSAAEESYLGTLFPMELYAERYRPCCVDKLKWDWNFNTEAVSPIMYKHWFTLMFKNPVIYFEAWVLNSFGFWTLNVPYINEYYENISGGVIRNLSPEYIGEVHAVDMECYNLLGNDSVRDIFVTDAWFIPVGWIFWAAMFLCVCMLLKKQKRMLCGLMPTLGLMIPIIIGTPICYWMRYAFAIYYLIPVYIMLFCVSAKKPCASQKINIEEK